MDEFVKKVFVACDKDQDGYLDRLVLGSVLDDTDQFKTPKGLEVKLQSFPGKKK